MRIIIESDDGSTAELSRTRTRGATSNADLQPIDGGQPSAQLLSALGAAATPNQRAGESNVTSLAQRTAMSAGQPVMGAAAAARKRSMQ